MEGWRMGEGLLVGRSREFRGRSGRLKWTSTFMEEVRKWWQMRNMWKSPETA